MQFILHILSSSSVLALRKWEQVLILEEIISKTYSLRILVDAVHFEWSLLDWIRRLRILQDSNQLLKFVETSSKLHSITFSNSEAILRAMISGFLQITRAKCSMEESRKKVHALSIFLSFLQSWSLFSFELNTRRNWFLRLHL